MLLEQPSLTPKLSSQLLVITKHCYIVAAAAAAAAPHVAAVVPADKVGAAAAAARLTNAADLHASACQGTQGGLGTRTRGLGLVAARSAQLDVQGVDAQLLRTHSSQRNSR
jgi:hypothetical protein